MPFKDKDKAREYARIRARLLRKGPKAKEIRERNRKQLQKWRREHPEQARKINREYSRKWRKTERAHINSKAGYRRRMSNPEYAEWQKQRHREFKEKYLSNPENRERYKRTTFICHQRAWLRKRSSFHHLVMVSNTLKMIEKKLVG